MISRSGAVDVRVRLDFAAHFLQSYNEMVYINIPGRGPIFKASSKDKEIDKNKGIVCIVLIGLLVP